METPPFPVTSDLTERLMTVKTMRWIAKRPRKMQFKGENGETVYAVALPPADGATAPTAFIFIPADSAKAAIAARDEMAKAARTANEQADAAR